mmetsp:Transcript_40657/g.90409  ORF Transcript_40657/g.90409 Transcript_40657/m.90409 type:complete len:152 (-) Transcript_40657:1546-2001(-)
MAQHHQHAPLCSLHDAAPKIKPTTPGPLFEVRTSGYIHTHMHTHTHICTQIPTKTQRASMHQILPDAAASGLHNAAFQCMHSSVHSALLPAALLLPPALLLLLLLLPVPLYPEGPPLQKSSLDARALREVMLPSSGSTSKQPSKSTLDKPS